MRIKEGNLRRPAALNDRASWRLRLSGFISSAGLIWLTILGYRSLDYYRGFLTHTTQTTLYYLAIGYSLYLLIFFIWAPARRLKSSKTFLTAIALRKFIWGIGDFVRTGPRDYTHPIAKLSSDEKRALLFSGVKLFFVPLMLNFYFGNFDGFSQSLDSLRASNTIFSIYGFNSLIFPLCFNLFLLVDTAFFTFGYLVESSLLGSKLRSVEPTFLGWSVALVCYPPFNGLLGNFVPWHSSDYAFFSSQGVTMGVRILLLLLMGFYASASVALGPKASNLTNRGIVGYGPYRLMRHPAYISKNLFWWITMLPAWSLTAAIGMGVWSFVYFMRAITEERHLSHDPDYLAYCKKTRYRFVPGIL